MGFSDTVAGLVDRLKPSHKSTSFSGIGNANQGIVSFEDDMIVSKPMIVFRVFQAFLNFIAMACFASVASFQAKWKVGPSGLSGFAIFVSVTSIVLSLFLLLVPVVYEKYDKLARLARALKEVRVGFILNGSGTLLNFLIAFITTISAWTQPGCKDPAKDPHADLGDGFKDGLPNWCNTKRAGAIFFWLGFVFWAASFVLTVMDWRSGKSSRPRDPPFTRPAEVDDYDDVADEESTYSHSVDHRNSTIDQTRPEVNKYSSTAPSIPPIPFIDNSAPAPAPQPGGYTSPTSRPSMDVYGAFSDPVPSGYSNPNPYSQPDPNRVSRTMQYADPYAAVRASITPPQQHAPPSYEHDGRY